MAVVPTNLRAMLDEMHRDQEARFWAMLTEQNDSLRNDITNQRKNILGEVRILINASQNGNAPPNKTEGSNDQYVVPPNDDQTV
ncbi:hypothetical protein JCGZ_05120 [Jatropha curcas]|uniref:Uncharacterized protein n=1 Tax=Jatropha curcas TaxID=180498 RepID=A0A067L3Y6_JATCU|nr:hypothetical protein JCGZ_05120 [Jatropha curcas]